MISVALCTHNGAAYLDKQIRSICEQSLVPDEIVLSDDASTDGSVDVAIEEVAKRSRDGIPALSVFRNAVPLGVTANFSQAVSACKGELIALCDQDDVWRRDRIQYIASQFIRRPGLLLLHSDAHVVDENGGYLGYSLFHALDVRPSELCQLHNGRAFDVFLRRNVVTGATTVFRRSLLCSALPFPESWLHDEWLALIASCIGEVDVVEEQLIDYRQHASNVVGVRRLSWREAVGKLLMPRGMESADRARKAATLLERMQALATTGPVIESCKLKAMHGRLVHQLFRANLPDSRVKRIFPIAGEIVKGNYKRFGPGLRVSVADLLQRA
jgi:glycosyltransferase involved in cell wall biosynthesis